MLGLKKNEAPKKLDVGLLALVQNRAWLLSMIMHCIDPVNQSDTSLTPVRLVRP
jgi:hypothetical protein